MRRIQVSTTKKPLFFYVNLAKVRRCCTPFQWHTLPYVVPKSWHMTAHQAVGHALAQLWGMV